MTKSHQTYLIDLNDTEWQILELHLPHPRTRRGRPREHAWRTILNAIFYVRRSGCAWSLLLHECPPPKTVYHYFRQWRRDGSGWRWSQSVKTAEGGAERGFDAGKRVPGRKWHIVTDMLGLLLAVVVTARQVQDCVAVQTVLQRLADHLNGLQALRWNGLRKIWAGGAFRGTLLAWVTAMFGWALENVTKLPGQRGFQVLPKRWVVERTFAWLNRQRRLSKDYERLPSTREAVIYVALIRLMLKRLAHAR